MIVTRWHNRRIVSIESMVPSGLCVVLDPSELFLFFSFHATVLVKDKRKSYRNSVPAR